MMNPLVEFHQVHKTYDGVTPVVQNLNLNVEEGEFLTLLGPSGSGKTTSLMMLAGFETPTRGSIKLNGTEINNVPAHKRGIGMVFQSYALFPHMTVAENLAYPLKVRRIASSTIKDKVERALDMVQLNGFAHRHPSQLSGGQRQRVALARAMIFEPKLVLMDEPLGALDKQLREHMQYEIKRLHDRLGVTIVYVTHDQGEALTMSNRIAIFNEGRVQQLATPIDLYEKPLNEFVASFIGENNCFSAKLTEFSGERWILQNEGLGSIFSLGRGNGEIGKVLSLSVRPERILLGARASEMRNRFQCRILERIYQGDHFRVKLKPIAGPEFIAKVPNDGHDWHGNSNELIYAGFHAEDCIAFGESTV